MDQLNLVEKIDPKFKYKNVEHKHTSGKKTMRKVHIQNGKGYKSVVFFNKGRQNKTVKRRLSAHEINHICAGKFIPGLFNDCHPKKKQSYKSL